MSDIPSADEYRANLVNGFYQTYLGRSAEASALTFWVVAMRAGVTSSNVQAAILGSDEYVRLHGGNTGFVSSLYTDLLGRAGSSTEIGFWGDALLAGTYSTASIAQAFVNSTEYRVRLIAGLYTSLLGRPVDAAGQTFWLTQLNAGQQREAIIQGIVSSAEFYAL